MNANNTNIALFVIVTSFRKKNHLEILIHIHIYIICKESWLYPNDENIGQTQSTDLDNNYKYNITCDI